MDTERLKSIGKEALAGAEIVGRTGSVSLIFSPNEAVQYLGLTSFVTQMQVEPYVIPTVKRGIKSARKKLQERT